MKPVVIAILIALCLLAIPACSDDKSSSSTSSSRDSDDEPSKSKDKDEDKDDEGKDEDDKDEQPGPDPGKTDTAEPTAERGFKDSKQPEGKDLDGTEIAVNQQYKDGERLKVSNLGFSYVVPKGQISVFSTGASAIQMGEVGGSFLTLIVARTGVTEAEARQMINTPYDLGNGNMLALKGEIKKDGDRLSAAMAASNMVGYVEMLIGKSTGVAIMTIGLPASDAECKTRSSAVADTVKFATPAGEKQRLEHEAGLMGKRASKFTYKGSSDYSHSSETNRDWHFGSDHTYEYIYRSTNSSTFKDGGGYAADNNDNHSGTWSIELTLGLPTLILRASDGRVFTHTLNVVKGWLHMDGQEVSSFGASDRKR
jgi:hypothetical protein